MLVLPGSRQRVEGGRARQKMDRVEKRETKNHVANPKSVRHSRKKGEDKTEFRDARGGGNLLVLNSDQVTSGKNREKDLSHRTGGDMIDKDGYINLSISDSSWAERSEENGV